MAMGYPTLFNHNVPQAYIESLKHIYCHIKAVNLEVPFTMLTEQNTHTYCATPDIAVKKRDERNIRNIGNCGEVASSLP